MGEAQKVCRVPESAVPASRGERALFHTGREMTVREKGKGTETPDRMK